MYRNPYLYCCMLRRFLSVALLLIFLFNLGGYYFVFSALSLKANRELSARLDAGAYNEQETITVSIPFSLPYPIQDSGFERINQRFNIDGEYYQVVKQKFENDVLTIVCVRDQKSTDIHDIIRTLDEQQAGSEGPVSLPVKAIQEFVAFDIPHLSRLNSWSITIGCTMYHAAEHTGYSGDILAPPRA